MHKKICALIALVVSLSVLSNAPRTVSAATCPGNQSLETGSASRLSGINRDETALAISRDSFADQAASAAIIARDNDFADGLVAGPFARMVNGPILLTPSAALPDSVLAELSRVLPKEQPVYLLGGTSALAPAIADQVGAAGFSTIERIAGPDRYQTAQAVANRFGSPVTAGIASGQNFPDALSLSAAAANGGFPILLTPSGSLSSATRGWVASNLNLTSLTLAGGLAAVSQSVQDALDAATNANITRMAGADRYETSQIIATNFFGAACNVSLARGDVFADALSAGPHAGLRQSPLLLTQPATIPASLQTYLETNESSINGIYLFGGELAVSEDVRIRATAMVDPATFIFYGDSGTDNVHWNNNAALLSTLTSTKDVDGIFMLGDNIYPAGASSANDPMFATLYEGPLASLLDTHEINVVFGNHDIATANGQYQLDYAETHPYWYQPDRYFARSLEHVRLVALDTNQSQIDSTTANGQTQLAFLADQANADPDALSTIVIGHHPVYSSGLHGVGDDQPWMAAVEPYLIDADVEFYLSGHDHNFEAIVPKSGVNHIVSGGASDIRAITPSANSIEALSAYHISELNVYYSYAELTVHGENGDVLFTHRYEL